MLFRNARARGSGGTGGGGGGGTTFASNRNGMAVGDSITRGFLTSTPWPGLVASFYSSTYLTKAHDGSGFIQDGGTGNLPANISEVTSALTSPPQTLIVFAGTNDITNGQTVSATISAATTYMNNLFTAGYLASRTLLVTCLPRFGLSEVTRSDFNTNLISLASSLGCSVCRVDLDSRIGLAACNTDTTYYNSDQIHPNDTGQGVIASLIEGAM